MGLLKLVRTRGYRNFMAKLYGWGASVVIIGALFKINHYPGADIMLIIGLGTESIIFFFSAFEPPHVEPDWSLVYPQLAGIYHGDEIDAHAAFATGETVTQELDKMLEQAKIGPDLIESLGTGLRNLSQTTSQLSNVSNASLANDQYVNTMKKATESASVLGESYSKTAHSLSQTAAVSQEQLVNMQAASKNAATLSTAYQEVAEALKEESGLNKQFISSLSNIKDSVNNFVEKYNESATILSKVSESMDLSATEGKLYSQQLRKISSNMEALNALYELHLQSSNEHMEKTVKYNDVLGIMLANLSESSANTARYKESLAALNSVVEKQVKTSEKQIDASESMHDSVSRFLSNLNESIEKTGQFKTEVASLATNIAALNKVYGNMLSAMNISINK